MSKPTSIRQIRLERRSPSYWRVTFDLPPLNIFGPLEVPKLETIIKSIEGRLFSKLDPTTIVMPGHGNDTTIARERPHLQEWVDRGW